MNTATPRVIKQPACVEPAFAPSRVVKSTAQTADRLLNDARAQAERIVSEATAKAAAIEADAVAVADGRFESVVRTLESLIGQERKAFAAVVYRAAALVSSTIIEEAIDHDPHSFVDLVQKVAQQAERYPSLRIALHPDDVAAVAPCADRIRTALSFAESVTFEADPSLWRGDVVVHTESGHYEGGLGHVLRSLQSSLAGRRNG